MLTAFQAVRHPGKTEGQLGIEDEKLIWEFETHWATFHSVALRQLHFLRFDNLTSKTEVKIPALLSSAG